MAFSAAATQIVEDDVVTSLALVVAKLRAENLRLHAENEQQREEVVSLKGRVTELEAREEQGQAQKSTPETSDNEGSTTAEEQSHSEGEEGSFEQGLAAGKEAAESSPSETTRVERGRKLTMEDLLGVADLDHRAQPKNNRQPMDLKCSGKVGRGQQINSRIQQPAGRGQR
ncbi:unnamed protein product [Polarella glacialis]|uniref:Uncharacterized protein n=1 Tax=Polarella glacialis TaxID=89957 RepID=A0A813EYM9_POLGL|nr:unnamed protein product [Polarella glacialis]